MLATQLFLTVVSARLFVPAAQAPVPTGTRPALPVPISSPRVTQPLLKTPVEVRAPSWILPLFAVLTAGLISATTPAISHASVEPLGVMQKYGASTIAAGDDDITERQKEFLKEREKLKQTYDADTTGTFKGEEEVRDKKNVYTTIVVGLVAIAFIAPMVQFFYYTGGD